MIAALAAQLSHPDLFSKRIDDLDIPKHLVASVDGKLESLFKDFLEEYLKTISSSLASQDIKSPTRSSRQPSEMSFQSNQSVTFKPSHPNNHHEKEETKKEAPKEVDGVKSKEEEGDYLQKSFSKLKLKRDTTSSSSTRPKIIQASKTASSASNFSEAVNFSPQNSETRPFMSRSVCDARNHLISSNYTNKLNLENNHQKPKKITTFIDSKPNSYETDSTQQEPSCDRPIVGSVPVRINYPPNSHHGRYRSKLIAEDALKEGIDLNEIPTPDNMLAHIEYLARSVNGSSSTLFGDRPRRGYRSLRNIAPF